MYNFGVKVKSVCKEFTDVPTFVAQASFKDILDGQRPGQCAHTSYKNKLAENVVDYKFWLQEAMSAASLQGKLAVFATHRTPSSRARWNVSRHVDCCECLTATGPLLHVMSLGEGCDATV